MYRPALVSLVALAAGAVLLALAAPLAAAPTPKPLGRFGDWEAFAEQGSAGKLCYAASLPKRSKNEPHGRGRAYALVSDRPADKSFGVVGVTAGFALKKGAAALLDVSGVRFDLYTVGDTAWSRDDKAVGAALLKGKFATFVGYPAKGQPVADQYGLAGFAEARAAIDKECGAGK